MTKFDARTLLLFVLPVIAWVAVAAQPMGESATAGAVEANPAFPVADHADLRAQTPSPVPPMTGQTQAVAEKVPPAPHVTGDTRSTTATAPSADIAERPKADVPGGATTPAPVVDLAAEALSHANAALDAFEFEVPSRTEDPPFASLQSIAREHDVIRRARVGGEGRLVVGRKDEARTLTIVPALQAQLTSILSSYQTPYAAVVVLEPSTGKILAMAEHSESDPDMRGLPLRAVFPAASIFKLVTATALMEAGLGPDDTECTHGGKRRVSKAHLLDTARDGQCMTLAQAMGLSSNGIFAKLTAKHLTPDKLKAWMDRFRFNKPLDFDVPVDISLGAVPEDTLPFAQTGAGFGDVYLSPLHAALIASVAANGGVWRDAVLFDDGAAQSADTAVAQAERVMSPAQADALADMMEATITSGTARRIFRERGFRVAGAVGKTGSLADKRPFRDYSWFVGFAPRDNPQVAVAAVVVNDMVWRIRGTWLGREALRLGLSAAAARATAPPAAAAAEEDVAQAVP